MSTLQEIDEKLKQVEARIDKYDTKAWGKYLQYQRAKRCITSNNQVIEILQSFVNDKTLDLSRELRTKIDKKLISVRGGMIFLEYYGYKDRYDLFGNITLLKVQINLRNDNLEKSLPSGVYSIHIEESLQKLVEEIEAQNISIQEFNAWNEKDEREMKENLFLKNRERIRYINLLGEKEMILNGADSIHTFLSDNEVKINSVIKETKETAEEAQREIELEENSFPIKIISKSSFKIDSREKPESKDIVDRGDSSKLNFLGTQHDFAYLINALIEKGFLEPRIYPTLSEVFLLKNKSYTNKNIGDWISEVKSEKGKPTEKMRNLFE